MPYKITMPQLSDTMTEGTVVKWRKSEGEKVKGGEPIADVETDKATMEMEAFESGTLALVLTKEGAKASVGAVIGVVATGSENPAEIKKQFAAGATADAPAAAHPAASAAAPSAPKKAVAAASASQSAGSKASATATIEAATSGEIHEPAAVGHGAIREAARAVPPVPNGNGHGRLFASPLAKRIAADHGIDLAAIKGSGPNGRVIQRDVLAIVNQPAAAAPAGQSAAGAATGSTAAASIGALPARIPSGKTEVIPLTKMRSAIARSLTASKQSIPHFYETIDVDAEALVALRGRLNDVLEPEKIRLSLGDFISKAVATALLLHPAVNATFNGSEITRHGDVHLGMAVAIPDGLIVPVIKNINQMGLKEIRLRSVDIVDRARAQRLKQDEMSGGTFTISNLGTFGIREFSAIINPPQVAILAVASAEKRAVVKGDAIVPRTMITLTLSADHRVVDGATAAAFLRTLKGMLEEPGTMLL